MAVTSLSVHLNDTCVCKDLVASFDRIGVDDLLGIFLSTQCDLRISNVRLIGGTYGKSTCPHEKVFRSQVQSFGIWLKSDLPVDFYVVVHRGFFQIINKVSSR